MNDFFLNVGERGLLIGQTGGGKSINGIYQLRQAEQLPVIIFDTKIEPAFVGVADEDETAELVENLPAFLQMAKRKAKDLPDYIIVRPAINELQNFELLDRYCFICYDYFGPCTIYFDEVYSWHNQGKAGNGLLALLTRGRSRGKTVLMATQRPSWISRFCITEAQKFYVHLLVDDRDKKTLGDVIPNFASFPNPPKYHFYFYRVGEQSPILYRPVPMQDTGRVSLTRHRWY